MPNFSVSKATQSQMRKVKYLAAMLKDCVYINCQEFYLWYCSPLRNKRGCSWLWTQQQRIITASQLILFSTLVLTIVSGKNPYVPSLRREPQQIISESILHEKTQYNIKINSGHSRVFLSLLYNVLQFQYYQLHSVGFNIFIYQHKDCAVCWNLHAPSR